MMNDDGSNETFQPVLTKTAHLRISMSTSRSK